MSIQRLRLLAAVSGMIAVAVGATLAIKAPCLLVEHVGDADYSIGPFIPFPLLPTFIVVVGVFTFALALRGRRQLSPLTPVCLGLLITSLTFALPDGGSIRIRKSGYPLAWLAEFIPPSWDQPAMGVIALPFLIDLAFWTPIVGAIIFATRRLWSDFSSRRQMERR